MTILKAVAPLLGTTALLLASHASAQDTKITVAGSQDWISDAEIRLGETFTAETGIEVTMETYDSNEAMLATLKGGAMGTYDLAVPGDYMVSILAA